MTVTAELVDASHRGETPSHIKVRYVHGTLVMEFSEHWQHLSHFATQLNKLIEEAQAQAELVQSES